ncbi:MAG: DUF494 family protein [Proteobacteria bacterium]|nr:DUF494 family protein [Pseudomonadota bacterium]
MNTLRQKILNILGHLSQSLQQNKDLFYDADQIWEELSAQGFSEEEILGALSHIEKTMLEEIGPFWSQDIPVCRVYSPKESNQISCKARGYLWKLKVRGIIDHALEDEIIEKAMNLEGETGLREIKTVAALTLFGYEHKLHGESQVGLTDSFLI